jgi:hypothetical protein
MLYLINEKRLLDMKQYLQEIDDHLKGIVANREARDNIRLSLMMLEHDLDVTRRWPAGGESCSCKRSMPN